MTVKSYISYSSFQFIDRLTTTKNHDINHESNLGNSKETNYSSKVENNIDKLFPLQVF